MPMSRLASCSITQRREAAGSLAEIGPAARAAAPALRKATDDDDYVVRVAAAEVLRRLESARED